MLNRQKEMETVKADVDIDGIEDQKERIAAKR